VIFSFVCFLVIVNIQDAVGNKAKIEFAQKVQVEVKSDKYESRILVGFFDAVYYTNFILLN